MGAEVDIAMVMERADLVETVEVAAPASEDTAPSVQAFGALDVVRLPGARADVMLYVQNLAGVNQLNDEAGLFVRGGDSNEVLTMLDEAVLYHPYQYETVTGGIRGTVDPFLTSGMPETPANASVAPPAGADGRPSDASGIRTARTELKELLGSELTDDQRSIVRYTVAYLDWRLSFLTDGAGGEDPDTLLDEVVALLVEDLTDNDANAESHALLASVYGLQIGQSSRRGAFLGRRAARARERAENLAPRNPRVLLLAGIGKLYTPRRFGRGEDMAESLLHSAVAAFRTDPVGRPWPRWGRIDAYAWLGQVAARRDDFDAAWRYYLQALDLEPDFAWVRWILLPALDQERCP